MTILKNDWADYLQEEFQKEYYIKMREFLKKEYSTRVIYPDRNDIFNAFHYTPYEKVKVVMLGQDPYHGPGQAHGLSFSVKPGVKLPPSLLNIFKELQDDLGYPVPSNGYLNKWAEQGILLLNTVLTVRQQEPNSHKGIGWENFTNRVIEELNNRKEPVIFVLWGRNAAEKEEWITNRQHYIIKAPHPSPLSAHRGFFGSRPFSKINRILEEQGQKQMDWQIT